MDIANQLSTIDAGFRLIASYPETKDKPIVIGESDPDGCAAELVRLEHEDYSAPNHFTSSSKSHSSN
jgi:hypothetical protein